MIDKNLNNKESAISLFEQFQKEKLKLIKSKSILDKKDNHTYPVANPPFNIPDNWIWCYLSDVSLIQEGPGIRKHQYTTTGIQFLTVTNILEGDIDLDKSKKYISQDQYKTYSHFTINKGDIVTACSGGSWGKSALYNLDNKLILNTSTLRLRFYNGLGDNNYLYYITKTNYFKDSLSSYITGQQPNYGYSHYSKILIPLPPLSEQNEIVSIIDNAFESIERAKSNAAQNLKNAKELFESYLQGVFENLYYKSSTQKIADLAAVTGGYSFKSESFKDKGKYQVLRMGNIRNGLVRESESPVYIDELDEKIINKALLQINDVIITQTGTKNKRDYGFTVIIEKFNFLLNQRIASIRFSNKILPKYFLYFSWTNLFRDQYFENETGTVGQGNVGIGAITSAKVPTISIKEQELLVNAIEELLDKTKKLEAIYQQKLNDLEELKKSILQKAFNGELKTSKISA